MKVLFCTDGSEASFFAIKKTLPFLPKDNQIDIINVIDWGFFPTYVTFPHEDEEGLPNQKNYAEDIIIKTKKLIENEGYKINKADYTYGHPDKIILSLIEKENYDLVVMGSHGKKGITKWLGSVSRRVVSSSPIPTLIARPKATESQVILKGSKDILIAVDGSEYSYNAIKKLVNILDVKDSQIELLTVRPGIESLPVEITMDNEWLENCLIKQKEIANEILETSKKILQEYGIIPKSSLSMEGDAAEVILDYIKNNEKDLVVLGSHGRKEFSDFLLGSVSKRVLDNATSPVLIVPTRKEIDY